MLAPELHALVDSILLDENPAVLIPVEFLFRRPVEQGEQALLFLDLGKQVDQLLLGIIGFERHAFDEGADVGAPLVIAAGNIDRNGRAGQ